MNFHKASAILFAHGRLPDFSMGKKSKKKTVASTRKTENVESVEQQKPKKKKLFGKLFKKKEKTSAGTVKEVAETKEAKKNIASQGKEHSKESEGTQEQVHKEAHKEEPKPKKEKRKILPPVNMQKLKGAILILVGTLTLVFIGIFLYSKIFRPQSLAKILPAESTIGFFEMNIDPEGSQPKQFFELLKKYPVYQKSALSALVNTVLPLDYEKDLKNWIGRKVGVAFIKPMESEGELQLIGLVETKDQEKMKEFLQSRVLKDIKDGQDALLEEPYKETKIFSYKASQSFYAALLADYLVVSGNKNLLQQLIDGQQSLRLENDLTYQKVANNLPQGGLGFTYFNTEKLFEALLKNPAFANHKGRDFIALQPFLKIFSAEGVSVFATDHQLRFQQFSAINRSELGGSTYLTFNEKYQGSLIKLASETPILFVGGHDLTKELKRLEEIFKGGTKASSLLFEGLVEAQKQKYFGKDIGLEQDIYPLLQGEYLVTVDGTFEQPVTTFFFELTDKNTDLQRIEKIANAFIKISAIFEPKIQEVTLPDGTKGQEVVASPEQITRTDADYQGIRTVSLKLGDLTWGINYAVLENTLVMSSNLETLQKIIDRFQGRLGSNLSNQELFVKNVQPLLRTADEMIHLKLGALTEAMGITKDSVLQPYLLPFGSLTVTKNFFDDGISTIYVVDVL